MLTVCPAASRSRICWALPATKPPDAGVRGHGSPRPASGASGTVVAGEPGSLVGICCTRSEAPGPMESRHQQVYPAPSTKARRPRLPSRRRESLRTTLWFVPAVLVAVAALVFLLTYAL